MDNQIYLFKINSPAAQIPTLESMDALASNPSDGKKLKLVTSRECPLSLTKVQLSSKRLTVVGTYEEPISDTLRKLDILGKCSCMNGLLVFMNELFFFL